MSEISLQLLGGFRLAVGGEQIEIRSRKSVAVIAYLALQKEYSARREQLAELLWPSSARPQARASLRQELYEIRGRVPEGTLETTRETASLSGGHLETDVDEFEQMAGASELEERRKAPELYAGELLEGIRIEASAFEDWLEEERRRVHERVVALLGGLIDAYEEAGELDRAIGAAVRLLTIDPVQESVHRELMELYMQRGQRGRALRQFQTCRDALRTQLGVSPASATRQLHRAIIQGTYGPEPTGQDRSDGQKTETVEPTFEVPELRQVAVLSVEFEYDEQLDPSERAGMPERATEVLEAALNLAERTAAAYSTTTVPRFGNEFAVVFGLRHATGSDTRDSVEAALELRRALVEAGGEVPARMYAGGTTGQVMVSGRSGDADDAVGAPFSRAGRLRGAAEVGEFLVDEALGEQVAHEFELEGIERKLRSMQVDQCWKVRGHLESADPATTGLVGRDRELGVAQSILDMSFRRDAGYAILVIGEAGIGKSRLGRAIREIAEQSGWRVHAAQVPSDSIRSSDAFARSLTESLVGLDSTSDTESRRTVVESLREKSVIDDNQSLFLAELLGLEQGSEAARAFDAMLPEVRHQGAAETTAELLNHLADSTPRLVILEDLHWVDETGARVARRILETTRSAPVIALATSRLQSCPFGESIDISSVPSVEMRLTALTREESLELVRHNAQGASESLVEACVERAEGHPFFLQQLARLGDCAEPPADVRSLVLSVTDDAAPCERHILRAASVLGRRFSADRLESMTGRRVDPDSDMGSRLLGASEGALEFVHDLARKAIYSSLVEEEKTRLHRLAAATYDEDLATRAAHLERAGSEEAPAVYLRAARGEIGAHRHERARDLLERALQLVEERELEFELTGLLAEQLRILGELRESAETYRSAVDLADGPVERARALTGIAAALRVLEEHEGALETLDEAERAIGEAESPQVRASIHYYRGCVAFPRGEMKTCIEEHEESLEVSREADLPRHRARALGGLADAHYMQGRMTTARDYFDECVELSRAHGFGRIEVANLHMRGLTELFHCNALEASEQIIEATERASQVGDSRTEMVASTVLCDVHLVRGCWESLRERADATIELAEHLGAPRFQALSQAFRGLALSRLGRTVEGRDDLEASWANTREQGVEFHGAGVAGICALGLSGNDERRSFIERGEAALSESSLSHNFLLFFPLAMLTQWEIEGSGTEAHAEKLAEHTRPSPLPWTDFFLHWASVADQDDPAAEALSELERRIEESGLELFSAPISAR